MSTKAKRPYDSAQRKQKAEDSRLRILKAAQWLFSRQGIDAVSIEEIALRAKLSAPTIYAVFKSKAGILEALIKQAMFGAKFHSEHAKLEKMDDPVAMLAQTARIARAIYDGETEGVGLLRGASAFSKALRAQELKLEKLRFDMQKARLELLFKKSAARPGLDLKTARQIMWMYTTRDIYRTLVVDCKWPSSQYETWLADTLVEALSDPAKR